MLQDRKLIGLLPNRGVAAAGLVLAALLSPGAAEAANATVSATFSIAIAGIPVGRADAVTRFQGTGYAMTISGSTSGLSRLVSDATTRMESQGRVSGRQLLAASYTMTSKENGSTSRVSMKMSGGSVVDVSALPKLKPRADRVPVTDSTLQNVLDPVSAFIVPGGGALDSKACNRTVRVFDGWSRFDIRLFYKETKELDSDTGAASKSVVVCGARYVPVAGHVPDAESVKYMADNKNLEVWLASVHDADILIPYRIVVGTQMGDLTIRATSVSVEPVVTRAAAE